MASSSDWVDALQSAAPTPQEPKKNWFDALLEPGGFVEGLPASRPMDAEHSALAAVLPEVSSAAQGNEPADAIEDAYVRGEAAGRAAAIAQAQAEHAKANENLRALRLSFNDFDQAAMDCLAQELAETVIALCGKAIADFVPDPKNLEDRCHQAAQRLGAAAKDCTLHLHPSDIELVDPETINQWKVEPDNSVERGGLHFEGADGAISDGPAQWRRAIAAAMRG